MTVLPAVSLAGAALALGTAPLLLARGWRRGADGRLPRLAGWLSLLAAAVLLAPATGAEVAVALAAAGLPLPAWALIAWRRDRRPAHARQPAGPVAGSAAAAVRRRRGWHAAARVLTAGPLSAVAALLCATQLSRLAGSMTAGLVAALAMTVLLWALAALWAFSDPLRWRPATALLLLALVSAWPLWLR